MADSVHDTIAVRLSDAGQRYTDVRRSLVSVLAITDRPLTLTEILACAPSLAQSSAYRNLGVLEEVGVVHRVMGADEHGRFELADEFSGHHHHHAVCTQCGTIVDIDVPDHDEHHLNSVLKTAARAADFVMTGHRVDIVGLCPRCAMQQ